MISLKDATVVDEVKSQWKRMGQERVRARKAGGAGSTSSASFDFGFY